MDKIKSVEAPDPGSSLVLYDSTDKNRMTSLEIAEITGKQHAHVMRDIRKLLEQGVSESNFGLSSRKQLQPKGGYKEINFYSLTPKGCLILASGYDALLRERIINRLEQLEKSMTVQPSYQIEDPIARAEAWIAEQKEKKMLEEKTAQQTIQHKVGSQWILYAKYLPCGYVQSETYTYTHKNGSKGARSNVKWTQKGRLFLYNILKEHGVLPLIEQPETNNTSKQQTL